MNRIVIVLCFVTIICGSVTLSGHPKFLNLPTIMENQYSLDRADSLHGFDVTKYDLSLNVNAQTHFINGVVTANVTAGQQFNGIDYNLIGLTVSEVKVNDVIAAYTHLNGILHINYTATPGQQLITKVTYSGTPQLSPDVYHIGIIFSTNTAFTLSDPDAGRYWWPSYDHPWDKAIVDLHITMRNDWLVACNGLRSSITDNGNGTKTHNWIGSNPMATYLVCFTAGPYLEINQTAGTVPIQNFVTQAQYNNAVTDFSTLPSILQFFETQFGTYPFEKYGNAVVSMTTYGAMEHQTMTTMGQQYITGNHSGELTIAHELAHQWYGDCLTPLTFKDVWLSEGFASYSELLWTHKKNGWQAACNYANSSFHQYYISWENSAGPQVIYNPAINNYFNPQSYEKAASVLHMLRLKIGNDHFFSLLQNWFTTYHNNNIITSEFQAMAEQISGQELDQFFSQWIYSAGIPSVEYTLFQNNDTGTARIWAKSTCPTGTLFNLEIPFVSNSLVNGDSLTFTATPPGNSNTYSLNPNATSFVINSIDPNHWVLYNQTMQKDVNLTQCLPTNHAVNLSWDSFNQFPGFSGYYVYRKTSTETTFTRITETPLTTNTYLDTSPQNGTLYQYKITAVDNADFETQGSNTLSATPMAFPFDWGMLVVDETKDGNGSQITPNDAMVDEFYAAALAPFNYTEWNYATMAVPNLNTLSHYPIILWHADDFSQNLLGENLNTLSSYLMGGGKLVISGWKTAGSLTPAFISQFMPGTTLLYDNAAALISANPTSATNPQLLPDPLKLASVWNGMLPYVYTFQNAPEALYTAEMTTGALGNSQALAVKYTGTGTLVIFGFPLYFMQSSGVYTYLHQLLPELEPTLPIEDNAIVPAALKLSCSPNPFMEKLNLALNRKIEPHSSFRIFNIKGQLINTIDVSSFKTGTNTLTWTAKDKNGIPLSAGIYLLQYSDRLESIVKKIVLLK